LESIGSEKISPSWSGLAESPLSDGQAKQDRRSHRALVALEMVEIGSGDSELARHRRLVEPALAAKPLQP
jgi:hypothetical protein